MAGMPCRIESNAEPRTTAAAALQPLPKALAWIEGEILSLRAAGLERPARVREGRQAGEVCLDGRTLLNFGSNNYLGLAGDVRLTRAASKGSCAEGFGAGASPLVSGHSRAHESLERAIAGLLGVEAALVFPSGFAANTATIAALAGPRDFIASDERNHASIIDGCRLSRARVGVYRHRDLAALDALLATARDARRRLIVSDTLFSMDGTLAPLAGLCDLAEKHSTMLLVDEAHATGIFGGRGSGLVEETATSDGVHVRVGTLSKALGAAGGFVAGNAALIHWLRHTARAWIFSTAHPPGVAAAATRAIGLLQEEPDRRVELLVRAGDFAARLRRAGLDIGDTESQIVPVIAGQPAAAVALADRLADEGFFVPAIRPPSVPHGASLVRVSLSWLHDESDLRRLAEALAAHAR
ncbi:8-amino-7-oxononanoate synthase [bacterium]|nr:8-amino-7-oxononanoate synthase [bacterium]